MPTETRYSNKTKGLLIERDFAGKKEQLTGKIVQTQSGDLKSDQCPIGRRFVTRRISESPIKTPVVVQAIALYRGLLV